MKTVYALLCTAVLLVVVAQLTGCAVNIVVAPNATFAVDSLNKETSK